MLANMIFGWAIILAISALAWIKGGPAERLGALIVLFSWVAVSLVHMSAPKDLQAFLLLGLDAFVAAGFLVLALRHMSLWLGAAMLLQAGQFSLHAYYLVAEVPHDGRYALINNLNSLGVLLCVLVGTLAAWRKRSLAAK